MFNSSSNRRESLQRLLRLTSKEHRATRSGRSLFDKIMPKCGAVYHSEFITP